MSQLPAHLQQYQVPDIGARLSANLGSAMPPHVSIGGGRFTLIDASNNEIPVPTFDPKIGVYLDACIIDVNEKMSRQYFAKPYDPAAPGAPPDCWSDNGFAASASAPSVPILQPPHPRAGTPAATCDECPMAVWGSKINPNGKAVPACAKKQKIALLIPGFPTLFLLAVPPNSHSFLSDYTQLSKGNNVEIANVITRISFVAGQQGTLQFHAIDYIDAPTAQLRQAAYVEKKTDALVGRNDVPRTAALAAPVQQQPAQQVQQTAPFVPPATAPVQTAQPVAPTATGVGFATQPASSTEGVVPARRRRRTAAEMAGGAQSGPGQQPAQTAPQSQPQAPFPVAGNMTGGFPPSQQSGALPGQTDMGFGMAQGQPTAGNPEVSQMLDNFFKQG